MVGDRLDIKSEIAVILSTLRSPFSRCSLIKERTLPACTHPKAIKSI